MRCWFCGSELIWQNDYDYSDYGVSDKEGIVAVLQCSHDGCNATFEGYLDLDTDIN